MTAQDLSTRANSCLTSMTCDQVAGNIVVAGFGDGGLRVYDRRLAPRDNMVRRYTGVHSSWVQNVHMQRGGNRELATAEYVPPGEGVTPFMCPIDIDRSSPSA